MFRASTTRCQNPDGSTSSMTGIANRGDLIRQTADAAASFTATLIARAFPGWSRLPMLTEITPRSRVLSRPGLN
jgi:hypothetical protein